MRSALGTTIGRVAIVASVVATIESMRPKQWVKNGIVFAALIFGGSLLEPRALVRVAIAAVLFSLMSGAVYLVNDVLDVEADRRHPVKHRRPIADGRLAPGVAIAVSIIVAIGTAGAAAAFSSDLAFVLAGYALLMLSYSLVLKRMVVVDVIIIAGGFVLRAIGGAVVIGVPVSAWLYGCTVLLALFIGVAKRRQELVMLGPRAAHHRRNLATYTVRELDILIAVLAAATVVVYLLYTLRARNLPTSHAMVVTVPLVVAGVVRYLYLMYRRDLGGSPEQVLLEDRPLQFVVVAWALASIAVLYVGGH